MNYRQKLQVYLSNLQVLNTKLHNLHWNVEGKIFFQLHAQTDELYDEVFAQYDAVAEVMKVKAEMPLSRLAEYLEIATLKEVKAKKFTPDELNKLISLFETRKEKTKLTESKGRKSVPIPSELKDKMKGVSLGKDEKGYYVYTHSARGKSHESPEKIPSKEIVRIETTG